jgi:DNA-directed RNA polymerase subunit RPC12/RpoP
MGNLRKRHKHRDGPAVIQCDKCGHRATTRARGFPALGADDLAGKVLRCSACGHRQTFGKPRAPVGLPGFRREGDAWIVELKNGERKEFETREAAWKYLDRTAPSQLVH